MIQDWLFSICGIGLVGIGLCALVLAEHVLRKILAINVIGIGIFMLLVATAYSHTGAHDPLPHAMVLTGIVVAIAGTALAVSLVCRIHAMQLIERDEFE
jgi:multicomponent Na+:H+ antiporter subunit C